MPQKEFFLTPEGLAKLEQELEFLQETRRHEVAEKIQRAKEMGGADHNAEYEDAKNERAFVEGRILTLEQMINNAVIIKAETASRGQVKLGSQVTVRDQDGRVEHYAIVDSAEVNPNEGKISHHSPVGSALLGHRVGEVVEVVVPAGVLKLRITEIR